MDDLHCTGKETKVQDCKFNEWGNHNCNHSEDVRVVCDSSSASCGQCTKFEKENSNPYKYTYKKVIILKPLLL